jgi:hypothetical protein
LEAETRRNLEFQSNITRYGYGKQRTGNLKELLVPLSPRPDANVGYFPDGTRLTRELILRIPFCRQKFLTRFTSRL